MGCGASSRYVKPGVHNASPDVVVQTPSLISKKPREPAVDTGSAVQHSCPDEEAAMVAEDVLEPMPMYKGILARLDTITLDTIDDTLDALKQHWDDLRTECPEYLFGFANAVLFPLYQNVAEDRDQVLMAKMYKHAIVDTTFRPFLRGLAPVLKKPKLYDSEEVATANCTRKLVKALDRCGKTLIGALIERTEERAISVKQLTAVVQHIQEHCLKDGWTSSNPALNGQLLNPSDVNLYDLTHWVIKPLTEHAKFLSGDALVPRQCSYVEMVASDAQSPRWFASHFWGEPVVDFVKCICQHSSDRDLTTQDCGPYWVCAYANNQWALAGDVSADPGESSFRKAMALAEGTVTILDKAAVTYTRVWCAYEIFVSLCMESKPGYLYDIYTVAPPNCSKAAVGITDGPVQIDQEFKYTEHHEMKSVRERSFPLELVEQSLPIKIQEAAASVEVDKVHILNAIAGKEDLEAPPPLEHESYEVVNRLLRGRFAVSSWLHALEADRPLLQYSEALRISGMAEFSHSFEQCDSFNKEGTMALLMEALPLAVQRLQLTWFCPVSRALNVSAMEALTAGLTRLPGLRALTLKMDRCFLEDEDIEALAVGLQQLRCLVQLDSVSLSLVCAYDHTKLGHECLARLARSLGQLQQIKSLDLDLGDQDVGDDGAAAISEAIAGLPALTALSLDLPQTGIQACGSMALVDALRRLERLTHLKLHLQRSFTAAEALAAVLLDIDGLQDLDLNLQECSMSSADKSALRRITGFSGFRIRY